MCYIFFISSLNLAFSSNILKTNINTKSCWLSRRGSGSPDEPCFFLHINQSVNQSIRFHLHDHGAHRKRLVKIKLRRWLDKTSVSTLKADNSNFLHGSWVSVSPFTWQWECQCVQLNSCSRKALKAVLFSFLNDEMLSSYDKNCCTRCTIHSVDTMV